jgi:putative transposase
MYKQLYEKMSKECLLITPVREKHPLVIPEGPNITWSVDFVSDKVECGRQFRVMNILDDFNRCAVGQEISMSMLTERVIWLKGKPENIRCDNGPEFISARFREWSKANGINIMYIQPGKPTQNSYIERFNGSYRRAVLDRYIFRNLEDVRMKTEEWMNDYNENRPHNSLGGMSPNEYKREYELKNIRALAV